MLKRVVPVAGVLGLLSIMLASSAAAGGGGGYGGPGRFTFTDTSANANLNDPAGNSTFVYVDRGYQSFKQKRTPGAPVVEIYGTVLNINQYNVDGTSAYGCWMIPDSAFAVASDLSSASLNANPGNETQCPGLYVGGAIGGKPGLQSSIGLGGGQPPTLIPYITANVGWAGTGAVWRNTSASTSHCQSYASNSQGTFDYEFAPASSSSGDLSGRSDPFAQVSTSRYASNSNSIPSGACNPFGF